MAKCPICRSEINRLGIKDLIIIGAVIGWLAFIGGQFFHHLQYTGPMKSIVQNLEERNDELRKGYVPPRGKSLKEEGK